MTREGQVAATEGDGASASGIGLQQVVRIVRKEVLRRISLLLEGGSGRTDSDRSDTFKGLRYHADHAASERRG
jgi:hypothetical protein